MANCTITIVIPACNGEKYIRLAIQSALDQSRAADEILIIDDASTDATADIIHSFDSKVKYIYNDKATGFVDAWNRAIEKASCDYVTILHHDDLLHPEYLAHIVKSIGQFPAVQHFYAACNYINDDGTIIRDAPLPHSEEPMYYNGKLYANNYLMGVISKQHIHRCPGVTTNRQLLLTQCSYRKEAGHIADDDFFYRVGRYTDVVGISFPLASFRLHNESETAKADLTERLTADYIYQARQTKTAESVFDGTDKNLICRMAVRFINELLFYKLLDNDRTGIGKTLRYADELEKIVPGVMKENLSAWAKIMWAITERNLMGLSRCYAHALNKGRDLRDLFKGQKDIGVK